MPVLTFLRRRTNPPGAAIPDAHKGVAAPTAALQLDQVGTELPPADETIWPSTGRTFRSMARGTKSQADIGQDTPYDARAAAHETQGSPDYRHTDQAEAGNAMGELGHDNSPTSYTGGGQAHAITQDVRPEAPPPRPRLGWTGADNTRPAWQIRPIFNRPFDKAIGAEHPATERGFLPSPVAMHATQTADLGHAFPSPGGSRGTRTRGFGLLRQAVRMVPGEWGDDKVQQTEQSTPPPTARGGFR